MLNDYEPGRFWNALGESRRIQHGSALSDLKEGNILSTRTRGLAVALAVLMVGSSLVAMACAVPTGTAAVSSAQAATTPVNTASAGPATPNASITEQPAPPPTFWERLVRSVRSEPQGTFDAKGKTHLGSWSFSTTYRPARWRPGARVVLDLTLSLSHDLVSAIRALDPKTDRIPVLITAERDFDPRGLQRNPNDEQVSTILTPARLPVEGGGTAASSRYTGYLYRTPIDVLLEAPLSSFAEDLAGGAMTAKRTVEIRLPADLPPGIYRLRFDFGYSSPRRRASFSNEGFAARPKDLTEVSCAFSPPVPADGKDFTGAWVDASKLTRHCYWVLLADYNSNGYRGVVAEEDKDRVAISPRHIIHDEVVLPRFDTKGNVIAYNLEPTFLMDRMNPQRNIPWNYKSGQWSVRVTGPSGKVEDLGAAKFAAKRGAGATTKNAKMTGWKPPAYGKYTVEAQGFIEDAWGNRYEGGGKYTFWIAKRMTMATATFQGQPYPVGNRYGRDIGFAPAVPADVTIKADLYVDSDPQNVRTVVSTGKATEGGIFGAAQGMKPLPLGAPGEYHARITATYWDLEGHLWVCVMRHAGVVYPEDSPLIAHGKKVRIKNVLVEKGETKFEGYVEDVNDLRFLAHINFPYNSGDAILIASEQQGANKIEPVLTYEMKGSKVDQDLPETVVVGRTNVRIKTSNGLSPHMFPEYITGLAYYYGAAPRPGFMSRFLVGEDNVRAPYWPTSRTNFGGQIGASNNGDLPGDIYRLLGGLVMARKGQQPLYAGYMSSAFILPKGSNNNRVIAAGSEDLPSPDGKPARFFMVATRPGMVYPVGSAYGSVLQIDPVVPCDVTYSLLAPDGRKLVTQGQADKMGYFVGKDKWILDQPGVWVYNVDATWNGHKGRVPGLPDDGGWVFVTESEPSEGPGITLDMKEETPFSPVDGLTITGRSTAKEIRYASVIPGAVLEQGRVPVKDGKFAFKFDPKRIADKIKTYDIVNLVNGRPEIGRVVHLTFFAEEQGPSGSYHSFVRVILRGTTALYVKTR
ncbi:MAG: hypothetical protein Q8P50_11030 [Bacillota bacterium]|nr:hypothetical protein [Bacillota bacterium]